MLAQHSLLLERTVKMSTYLSNHFYSQLDVSWSKCEHQIDHIPVGLLCLCHKEVDKDTDLTCSHSSSSTALLGSVSAVC